MSKELSMKISGILRVVVMMLTFGMKRAFGTMRALVASCQDGNLQKSWNWIITSKKTARLGQKTMLIVKKIWEELFYPPFLWN